MPYGRQASQGVPGFVPLEPYLDAALATLGTAFLLGQPSQAARVLQAMLTRPQHAALLAPYFEPLLCAPPPPEQPQLFLSLFAQATAALEVKGAASVGAVARVVPSFGSGTSPTIDHKPATPQFDPLRRGFAPSFVVLEHIIPDFVKL